MGGEEAVALGLTTSRVTSHLPLSASLGEGSMHSSCPLATSHDRDDSLLSFLDSSSGGGSDEVERAGDGEEGSGEATGDGAGAEERSGGNPLDEDPLDIFSGAGLLSKPV